MAKKKEVVEKDGEETAEKVELDPFIKAILGKKVFDGIMGFGSYIPSRGGISTGSVALDLKLGGQLPRDRVIEYFGPPGSGKTSMALIAMKSYADKYGYDRTLFIIDVERSITEEFVRGFGLDPSKILIIRPRTAEAGLDVLVDLVRSGRCGFGIFDSVDAMETEKESERVMTEMGMAELPKLMSRLMRKLCKETVDNDTGIIFINQIRATMSMYGPSEATSGGKALPYYSHVRIRWVAKPNKTEKANAFKMSPRIIKNKTASLITAESEFEMVPGVGVEQFVDYLEAGIEVGVITQGGPMYKVWDDKEQLVVAAKGKEGLEEWMFKDGMLKYMRQLIDIKWDKIKHGLVVTLSEEEQLAVDIKE